MKKFEPHYRLVRYGAATKIEKASRQQRMYIILLWTRDNGERWSLTGVMITGKQRKNRAKTVRGVAKGKAATKDKKK